MQMLSLILIYETIPNIDYFVNTGYTGAMPTPSDIAPRTRGFKKKERTRRQLIEAAVDVIAERGEAFSVSDVATRAGVSNGTFYNYFADRDALIEAIVPEVVGAFTAENAVAMADEDPVVRFASITAMALTQAIDAPDRIRVLLRLDAAQQAIASGDLLAHLRDDIAAGFTAGRFDVEPGDAVLDVIVGALLTAARRLAAGEGHAAYPVEIIELLMRTLGVADAEATTIADHAVAAARGL
jgi:AcrR family transcriptional regulator